MRKVEEYREALRGLADWEPFLLEHSGLPGPRANLELIDAVADEADAAQLRRWATLSPDEAPAGGSEEFLAACGVVGLGRLVASGETHELTALRRLAGDPRWRVREAVAIALQRWGDADFPGLLEEMRSWARGSALERRAAVAALCEPRLLSSRERAREVLDLLGQVTAQLPGLSHRTSAEVRTLRKTLGYGWSVAIVASPEDGKERFEALLASDDPDIRWLVRENLRKKRLERMDAAWTGEVLARTS